MLKFTQSFQNVRSKFSLHMFPHNGETSTLPTAAGAAAKGRCEPD